MYFLHCHLDIARTSILFQLGMGALLIVESYGSTALCLQTMSTHGHATSRGAQHPVRWERYIGDQPLHAPRLGPGMLKSVCRNAAPNVLGNPIVRRSHHVSEDGISSADDVCLATFSTELLACAPRIYAEILTQILAFSSICSIAIREKLVIPRLAGTYQRDRGTATWFHVGRRELTGSLCRGTGVEAPLLGTTGSQQRRLCGDALIVDIVILAPIVHLGRH